MFQQILRAFFVCLTKLNELSPFYRHRFFHKSSDTLSEQKTSLEQWVFNEGAYEILNCELARSFQGLRSFGIDDEAPRDINNVTCSSHHRAP